MTQLDDIQIARDPEPPADPPPPPDSRWAWGVGATVLVVALLSAFYWWPRGVEAPVSDAADVTPAPSETPGGVAAPLGAEAEAIDLPPLGETDSLVRDLLGRLSSSPALVAWLATDGLIRNAVVVVDNIATGVSPAPHLRVLRPTVPFAAATRDGRVRATEATHARYDWLADAFVSIDPDAVARLYTVLKPRLDEAYQDLGAAEGSFDAAVARAITRVLQTPLPDPSPPLVAAVESYRYADAGLESLPPVQKQVLRLGPVNQRRVQAHLRAVATSLGIDRSRLP